MISLHIPPLCGCVHGAAVSGFHSGSFVLVIKLMWRGPDIKLLKVTPLLEYLISVISNIHILALRYLMWNKISLFR